MRKINSSGGKLLATALVMVTLLCATRLNTDYTSASQAELGQGVLISTPVQTNNSMSNLQAGIFDWKVWQYVEDGFKAYERAFQKVIEAPVEVVKRVADLVPMKSEVAMSDYRVRANVLLADLDR